MEGVIPSLDIDPPLASLVDQGSVERARFALTATDIEYERQKAEARVRLDVVPRRGAASGVSMTATTDGLAAAGDPEGDLEPLQRELHAHACDARLRVFPFGLPCVPGQRQRAAAPLQVHGEPDASALGMVAEGLPLAPDQWCGLGQRVLTTSSPKIGPVEARAIALRPAAAH